MARAHASGIKVRAPSVPDVPTDEPRVVLSVETNPRKVPTHKRLLEGRDADGTRAALLPGTPGEAALSAKARAGSDRPAPMPAAPPSALASLPGWMRVALVLVTLLLVIGIVRRTRIWLAAREAASARPLTTVAARPPPIVEPPPKIAPAASASPVEASTPPPPPKPTNNVAATTVTSSESTPKPKPAPPPKPAFTPFFQLPGEKTKP
ncbi:MAG: hypothetical protein QM820_57865 [Minicystis sp.]